MQLRSLFRLKPQNSLRLKVSLGIVLPVVFILGIFTLLEYRHLRNIMLGQLSLIASQSGQVIEDNLRQQMLENDFVSMQKTLDIIGENQGFRSIYLLDTQGEVIFAPFEKDVGLLLNKEEPGCQVCHSLPTVDRMGSVVVTTVDGTDVFRSMKPIENSPACSQCHDPEQSLIGLLLIDMETGPLEASVNRELSRNALWWGATIIVVLIVVNLVLNQFVLRPLEGFASAFKSMSLGQHPPRLPERQADEIGHLAKTFNLMTHQVETRQAENIALSISLRKQNMERGELLKRLITAQEDERKRIARELHDELGQSLSALYLHTDAILRLQDSDPKLAREQTELVKQLVVNASDQMHDLIMALRPSVLDDLGLTAALRSYAERTFENTTTHYSVDAHHFEGRLPPAIETLLYRIFQEAINNISRHANATEVYILLSKNEHAFIGKIRDNGVGFDSAAIQVRDGDARGLGLLGMQERVMQCGGSLEIQSNPGTGTTISIYIPLNELTYE